MNTTRRFTFAIFALLLALGLASPALAQDAGAAAGPTLKLDTARVRADESQDARVQARIEKGKERATKEIDRRIQRLTDLSTRVQGMKRVSDTVKASTAASVQAEVASLTALKAKIAADTDIETLKADIQSITKSYRIFMLIIPQGRITVAADKIHTAAGTLTELGAKLQARIDAAASAGADVAPLTASLTDMKAQIAKASAQADAAVSAVASLTPDMGDKAKMDANNAALKDARAKLKAGHAALVASRASARSIVQGLKSLGASASASAEASAQ